MGTRSDSTLAALEHFARAQRMDADETAILARELEHVESVLVRTRYPDLLALEFVPMIAGIDPGLAAGGTYTWRRQDKVGRAKVIANMANDFPGVDISMSENFTGVKTVGVSYGYTVDELRAFALAQKRGGNISLEIERALAARHFIDRKVDEILSIGIAETASANAPIVGLTNNGNVNLVSAVAGSWGTVAAPAATAQQMLQDLFAMERTVFVQSKQTAVANVILLPPDAYALCSTTPLGTNNDKTVLDFFIANSMCKAQTGKPIEVRAWYRLTTAGSGGVARAICYMKDPMVLGGILPIPFEQLPPQPHNAAFTIPCKAACGGTVIKYPLACVYMDSISG